MTLTRVCLSTPTLTTAPSSRSSTSTVLRVATLRRLAETLVMASHETAMSTDVP